MARHTKTRTFTAEFYRLIASAPVGAGRGETNVLASATFDYANSAADGPLNTTFRRDPTSADKNNVVVMDTLVLRGDSDDMADPATLATITIDSAPSGTRRGHAEGGSVAHHGRPPSHLHAAASHALHQAHRRSRVLRRHRVARRTFRARCARRTVCTGPT